MGDLAVYCIGSNHDKGGVKDRVFFTEPEWLCRFSRASGAFVAASALLVLLGWLFGVEWLIRILPNDVTMNPMTALGFICLGLALWQKTGKHQAVTNLKRWLPYVLAGSAAIIGAMKLAQCLSGWSFHIDRLLFVSRLASANGASANEMAPNTALDFLLCGLAIILMDFELKKGARPAQALVLIAGLIALLALIGYSYSVLVLYRLRGAIPMELATAMDFAVFCLGFLAARPQSGIMRIITSATTGGATARRLLPMAAFVPWVLGAILLAAEQKAFFRTDSAISIFAVANIFIFTALVWWNAKLLYKSDLERIRTERRVLAQHSATRVLAESSKLSEAAPAVLQRMCEALGCQAAAMWVVEQSGKEIRCAEFWSAAPEEMKDFAEQSRARRLRKGEGLPGQVWAGQEPLWIRDIREDREFPRADAAAKAGLRSGFAFPIMLGTRVFGTMEFFSRSVEERDRALLEIGAAIGGQIGQFIESTRAQEGLQRATANLERSNAELQQFAYTASHDLNEPLRMITSYLQLLQERSKEKLDSESREFIRFALDGAQRMRALIADLLAYSRLEAKRNSFEPTDCEAVFQTAVQNLRVAIEENNATIEHKPLPRVRGDPVQLVQVFQNLIGNALKFHGAERPRVEVGANQHNGEWRFSFHDNGIGIDPKYFDRIFVIFQRLHTRQEYSGTGMGLAICKKIIERHGGRIWVESAPPKGSTFYFTLPVMPEQKS
jgi:signal transduction histidine kinase